MGRGSEAGEEKRRLRRLLEARRRALPEAAARRAAEAIATRLAEASELERAERVALYAALPGEPPSEPLFELCRRLAKPVLLPRVRGSELEFAPVEHLDGLPVGRYGVREPPAEVPPSRLGVRDLVLVPGVAFDRHGHRLGRGAGYYDRAFPPGSKAPRLVGVGYAFQLLESLPHEPWDRAMDAVVTEEELLRASGGRGEHADQ